jgi:abequosyltransferase
MDLALLSICIPTINRAELILRALNSISQLSRKDLVQVCISNNSSTDDYSQVENKIVELRALGFRVDYKIHPQRITLDENMLFVSLMAKAQYLYYLGDDDYFAKGGLDYLIDIIYARKPDLLVFNKNYSENPLGLEGFSEREFASTEEAYIFLSDKCAFGAVLLNSKLLNPDAFKTFFGTSHAYGTFWINLLNSNSNKIIFSKAPVIVLGRDVKTYSQYHQQVLLKHIPAYFDLTYKLTSSPAPLRAKNKFQRNLILPHKLLYLRNSGLNINQISEIFPGSHPFLDIYLSFISLIPAAFSSFLIRIVRKIQ